MIHIPNRRRDEPGPLDLGALVLAEVGREDVTHGNQSEKIQAPSPGFVRFVEPDRHIRRPASLEANRRTAAAQIWVDHVRRREDGWYIHHVFTGNVAVLVTLLTPHYRVESNWNVYTLRLKGGGNNTQLVWMLNGKAHSLHLHTLRTHDEVHRMMRLGGVGTPLGCPQWTLEALLEYLDEPSGRGGYLPDDHRRRAAEAARQNNDPAGRLVAELLEAGRPAAEIRKMLPALR